MTDKDKPLDWKAAWLVLTHETGLERDKLKARVAELKKELCDEHWEVDAKLEAKTAQVDRMATALGRILKLAANPVNRPRTMRNKVAGIAAGAIAANGALEAAGEAKGTE